MVVKENQKTWQIVGILIWSSFILLIGFFTGLEDLTYLLFSVLMFCFTYVYNRIIPIKAKRRSLVVLLIVPSIILWYTIFVYNDFLSIAPLSYELFVSLFLIYSYLMFYILKKNI